VNDSAVCQYYDPRNLPHDGEATISLVLGVYSRAGFTGTLQSTQVTSSVTSAPAAQTATTAAVPPAPLSPQAVKADLSTVDEVLARIDAAVQAAGTISDDALAQIESTLKDLRARAPAVGTAASK
jgi:hypothetical protein